MFIFERSNDIFSINIFPYFIVNTVTIVSTLLLQKQYKAFEYHNNVFYCLPLGPKFVRKAELTQFAQKYQ